MNFFGRKASIFPWSAVRGGFGLRRKVQRAVEGSFEGDGTYQIPEMKEPEHLRHPRPAGRSFGAWGLELLWFMMFL